MTAHARVARSAAISLTLGPAIGVVSALCMLLAWRRYRQRYCAGLSARLASLEQRHKRLTELVLVKSLSHIDGTESSVTPRLRGGRLHRKQTTSDRSFGRVKRATKARYGTMASEDLDLDPVDASNGEASNDLGNGRRAAAAGQRDRHLCSPPQSAPHGMAMGADVTVYL